MIKVCHIITYLETGGAQGNTLHTVANLDRSEFEPILVSGVGGDMSDQARAIPQLEWHTVPSLIREISPVSDIKALADLTHLLRKIQPDVVHTHCSKAGILGRLAASMARVPVVIHTFHGFGFNPMQSPAKYKLFLESEKLSAPFATAYIAVSQANVDAGKKLGVFGKRPVHLIRSGVALTKFRETAKHAKRGGEVLRIGCVGCLKPQKAPVDFVRVAAQVHEKAPNTEFILCGEGELRPEVEAEVSRLGLTDSFTMLGLRRDVPEVMASLDILVHTSRFEGLPRVFPEAMASGLPIVATAVDGATDIIEDGVNGFLCSPGDVDGLARRTLELIADPKKAAGFTTRYEDKLREFDIDQMVRSQEELYRQYLATARVSRRPAAQDSSSRKAIGQRSEM